MDIEALRIAHLVSLRGSFAAVAREQNVDASSISRSVAGVEGALGLRLFHRSTRALSLTEDGAAYLKRVVPLLDALDEAAAAARRGKEAVTGTLRLSASVAFGTTRLVPLLPAFREAYPDLTLDLVLEDAETDLVADGIDLALRLAPEPSGDLICRRLARTRYHVCATPDVAAHLTTPDALTQTSVLRQNLPGFRDAWQVRSPDGTHATYPVSGPLLMTSPLALLATARDGIGPALLADWLSAEDVAAGRLVRLWPDHAVTATSFDTALWLVFPSRSYLPARTRAGIDFLTEHLGD